MKNKFSVLFLIGLFLINCSFLLAQDIFVSSKGVIPNTSKGITATSEGFEGVTFPPAGWSSISVLGAKVWTRSTSAFHTGTASALMDYESLGGEDWLITNKIAVLSGESLTFWVQPNYTGFAPDSLIVRISTTDSLPASFTTVLQRIDVSLLPATWAQYIINLSAYSGQNVFIAFQHKDVDGCGIYLDDVSTGTISTNPDVATKMVIAPTFLPSKLNLPCIIKVGNVGLGAAGIVTNYTRLMSGTSIVSTITSSFTSLPVGADSLKMFYFPYFGTGPYGVNNRSLTTGDPVTTNDSLGYFRTTTITSPVSAQYGWDDGTAENNIGFTGGGSAWFLEAFYLSNADTLTGITLKWGAVPSSVLCRLQIWNSDPTTGLPTTVRDTIWSGNVVTADSIGFKTYTVAPGRFLAPGKYYIGIRQDALLASTFIAAIDQTGFTATNYPPYHSVGSTTGLSWTDIAYYYPGIWMIRPQFSTLITGTYQISSVIPDKYSLSQNYPNPFNPTTKIDFAIPKSGLVTMKLYDMLGREMRTLVNEVMTPGYYSVDLNGATLASGVYFYKLSSGNFTDVKRMMLIK